MKVRVSVNSVEYIVDIDQSQTLNDLIQKLKTDHNVDITDKEIFYFGEDYDGNTTIESLGYFEGAIIYIEKGESFSTINASMEFDEEEEQKPAEEEEDNGNSEDEDEDDSDDDIHDPADLFNMLGRILLGEMAHTHDEMTPTKKLLNEYKAPTPNDYIYNVKLTDEQKAMRQQNLAAAGALNILSISAPELHQRLDNRGISDENKTIIQETLGLTFKNGKYQSNPIPIDEISLVTDLAMANGVSNQTAKHALMLARGEKDIAQEILNKLNPSIPREFEVD